MGGTKETVTDLTRSSLHSIRESLLRRTRPWLIRLAWRITGQNLDWATPLSVARNINKGYDNEEAIRPLVPVVRDSTQLSYERLATLYNQVRYIEVAGLAGAMVECGSWRGGASGMMAMASLRNAHNPRHLHIFDSFEGMPEPRVAVDGVAALKWTGTTGDGALRTTGVNVASAAEVEALVVGRIGYPADHVHIHAGWFQETIPAVRESVGPIALLRLDGDFYDSTRVPLEGLYDQVVAGGVIVIDDYGHFEGCRRAVDEFLKAQDIRVYLGHIDYTGRYFIKPGPPRLG